MYAVDDLGDAIDVTRNFLTPIHLWTWIKLAIVVFFIGGMGFGGFPPVGDVGMVADAPPADPAGDPFEELDVTMDELLVIAGIILLIGGVIWLIFAIIAAIMEFVFIESLRTTEVRIRRYAKENVGRALHLFIFRAVVGLISLAAIAIPTGLLVLGSESLDEILGSLVLLGVFAFLVYTIYAIVMRFTSEFVAPVMLHTERGILRSWRRFWSTFTAHWTEYVLYLILIWIVQLVVGIAVAFIVAVAAVVIAIPFVILIFLSLLLGDVGVFLAVIIGFIALLLFIVVAALIWVPIASYFKYYALLLLGDTDEELDLIPDQRTAARSDDDDGRDPDSWTVEDDATPDSTSTDWDERSTSRDDRDDEADPFQWGTVSSEPDTDEDESSEQDESSTRNDSSNWDDSSTWDDDSQWDRHDDADNEGNNDDETDEDEERSTEDGRGW